MITQNAQIPCLSSIQSTTYTTTDWNTLNTVKEIPLSVFIEPS